MRYTPLSADVYKKNRERFIAQMRPNSLAIFVSNEMIPISADALYPFKQNPDFLFLSGIDQEECALILFPDAPDPQYKEVLFLRKTNELIALWEGHKYSEEEGRAASGVEKIMMMESFDNISRMLIFQAENIYLNTNEHYRGHFDMPYKDLRLAREMRAAYPLHEFYRAQPIIGDLRMIKQEEEVAAVQTACNITRDGFARVMNFIKPGVMEYEIEAEITHEFLRQRASGHAYEPILGSGKSACVLHYIDNDKECKDGDLILMDFGARYANYAADLTRTIPVNGRFSNRQKSIYEAVLRVHKAAVQMLRPGTLLEPYHKEVGKLMEDELIQLGVLDKEKVAKQDADKPLYKKYMPHGISHHLGLDVHDVGDRFKEMQPGMIFTVEPGLYFPDEGIGVRIENDILVTDGDPKDLMADIPFEVEEIEEIMNSAS